MFDFDPFDLNHDGVVDGFDAFIFNEIFGDDENDDSDLYSDSDDDEW